MEIALNPHLKLTLLESDPNWDSAITSLDGYNYYQSAAWGTHKRNQGWKTFKITLQENEKTVLAFQLFIKFKFGIVGVFWIPGGPCGDRSKFKTHLFKEIAKLLGLRFYVVRTSFDIPLTNEEENQLYRIGWKRPSQPLNSGESLVIDLQNLEETEASMTQNWRHNLKRASKKSHVINAWREPSFEKSKNYTQHSIKIKIFPAISRQRNCEAC